MHKAEIERFVEVIALEESAAPEVVRQAVLHMLDRYEGAEGVSRKDYKKAQSMLRQEIRESQKAIMPHVGEILTMRVERIAANGSAEGRTEHGVRIVLPQADQHGRRRTHQTIAVTVASAQPEKNLAIVSEGVDDAVTHLFIQSAEPDLRLRSITRIPGRGTLIGVAGTLRDPTDAEMAAIELRMSVALKEDVRLARWSEHLEDLLRGALPHEADVFGVEVQGKRARVYTDDLRTVLGPGALHTRLASMLTGLHIEVRKVSTLAEACGCGEVRQSAAG